MSFRVDESHSNGQSDEARAREFIRSLGSNDYYVVVDFGGQLSGAAKSELPEDPNQAAVAGFAVIGNKQRPNREAVQLVADYYRQKS